MNVTKMSSERSLVLLIDVQEGLAKVIWEAEARIARARFLLEMARLLEVPILATEQNPTKMGATVAALQGFASETFAKQSFSACGSAELVAAVQRLERDQIILVGCETHICVTQTGLDLQRMGLEVAVAEDAVAARSESRHRPGLARLERSGVDAIHTEAIAYEWLGTADHPKFRDALAIVKAN